MAYIYLDYSSINNDLEKYYWWDSPDCAYIDARGFKDFYSDMDSNDWNFFEKQAYLLENWTDFYHIGNESWDVTPAILMVHFKEKITSPHLNYSQYLIDIDDLVNNSNSPFRSLVDKDPYGRFRDVPIWTGTYIASLSYHYAVACEENNAIEANEVLRKLFRPVQGLHILTHVSGLPGNLNRLAIKDTPENREKFESFFYNIDSQAGTRELKEFGSEDERYPGQGEWEGWWYIGDTSKDQHDGLLLGWPIAYKLLTDNVISGINETLRSDILELISNDAQDVIDCLLGSNWNVLGGEVEPGEGRGHDGASFFPRIPWEGGGMHIYGFLALGKMINPNKYKDLYAFALNRYSGTSYHYTATPQTSSYFGNNLAFDVLFPTYFMAENDGVKAFIRNHYNNDFYQYVKFHRNVMFNLGWFIVNEYNLEEIQANEGLEYRLDDVCDNMYRFAQYRFPSRHWYVPDKTELAHPTTVFYHEIFKEESNHILKTLYGPLFQEITSFDLKSKFALTCEELNGADYVWQKDPFNVDGSDGADSGDTQDSGIDFTLPYWMGRYYGYFN